MKHTYRALALTLFTLLAASPFMTTALAAGTEEESEALARIVLVDAVSGSVKLRTQEGFESTLKKGDTLDSGDRLSLGSSSTADIRLSDGSIIRLSPGSEFVFERTTRSSSGFQQWVFSLVKGIISGAIQKSESSSSGVKVRVSTESAAIGIRGTEFTFGLDEGSGESVLETKSGEVLMAPAGNDFSKPQELQNVRAGFVSSLARGAPRAAPPMAMSEARDGPEARFKNFFRQADQNLRSPLQVQQRFQDMPQRERQELRDRRQQQQEQRFQDRGNRPTPTGVNPLRENRQDGRPGQNGQRDPKNMPGNGRSGGENAGGPQRRQEGGRDRQGMGATGESRGQRRAGDQGQQPERQTSGGNQQLRPQNMQPTAQSMGAGNPARPQNTPQAAMPPGGGPGAGPRPR